MTEDDFRWAINEATAKKKQDFSKVEFLPMEEGLYVQCLHVGSYDDEPATVEVMHEYAERQGCALDFSESRVLQGLSASENP